jgi:zinc/manganese transport system substrate-binding protein
MARSHPCLRWLVLVGLLASVFWPRNALAELDVATTVPSLASIAKAIGKEHVSVSSLALASQDPHFVDAKPSLALKLHKADLLIAVGLQLESGWLPTLQTGARNPAIQSGGEGYLEAASFVKKIEASEVVDRSKGDIHPGGNPHFLYDPRAAAAVAKGISDRMVKLDPDHAGAYQKNLAQFIADLEQARKGWEKRLAPHKDKRVIGYHKTWGYLTDWLGLEQVAFLEPKPGIPPTPKHVAAVIATARAKRVRVILQESFYPDATAKLVAEKAGATLVVIPGGAEFPNQSYIEHIEGLVSQLEKAL